MLELGPGTGANVAFFDSFGAEYIGIDQSKTAMDLLQARYPQHCFWLGDFIHEIGHLPKGYVDLVVDRASLPHNEWRAIARCVKKAQRALKAGGHFIGVDWFSTDDTHHERFKDLGTTTRLDAIDLGQLFPYPDWEMVALEHVRRLQEIGPLSGLVVATWNLVVRRC